MRNGVNKNNDENQEKKKAKIKCFREVIKVMISLMIWNSKK